MALTLQGGSLRNYIRASKIYYNCPLSIIYLYEVGDRSRGPFKGFTSKLAIFTLLQNTLLIWEKSQKITLREGIP